MNECIFLSSEKTQKALMVVHSPQAVQYKVNKKIATLQPQGLEYTREPKVQGPERGHG